MSDTSSSQTNLPLSYDRETLEMGEARDLLRSFNHNGRSTEWLDKALRITVKNLGKGADERVRNYMRRMYRGELT